MKIARKALRERLLTLREGLDGDWRETADRAIARRLADLVDADAPRVIAVYAAMRGEPELGALFAAWRDAGRVLALPVTTRAAPLRFCRWDDGAALGADRFGVAVPLERVWVEPDCLIIPCVGFHRAGNRVYRIGYGGGYFDRTLAERPITALGVAYDALETSGFEPAPYDRPLTAVVTESRVISSIASP